ncbi:hypothetical protein [Altererythrobacter sp. TH136]|uniref:hypothetical protein n=1 Tax=Altererythrobacter sp. TH136 TaxID=2067415 RepID=UPI001AEF8EE3|nr:hypothetical protein [Altererythrobacter sp. TH136]
MDQYLYSYGPMIACQWAALGKGISLTSAPVRLVDYGCGQGLAGLLLYDQFGDAFATMLRKVVLVEPSPVALVRAEAIYQNVAPDSEMFCVNKGFDEVTFGDLEVEEGLATIHVFSNVLDIKGFDQFRLLGEIMTDGVHTILAVSHDRDFDGGTERIRSLKAALEDPSHADALTVSHSEMAEFRCGPGDKYPVVSWHVEVEVRSNG